MLSVLSVQRVLLGALDRLFCFQEECIHSRTSSSYHPKAFQAASLRLGRLAAVSFSFDCAKAQSTLAGGLKPKTLSRLHKYTQANRAYCFTVARICLAVRARIVSLYPSVRALTSTARIGFVWPYQLAMVGEARVERTSSDFQSGVPTLYTTRPYKPDCVGIEPTLGEVQSPVHRTLSLQKINQTQISVSID